MHYINCVGLLLSEAACGACSGRRLISLVPILHKRSYYSLFPFGKFPVNETGLDRKVYSNNVLLLLQDIFLFLALFLLAFYSISIHHSREGKICLENKTRIYSYLVPRMFSPLSTIRGSLILFCTRTKPSNYRFH